MKLCHSSRSSSRGSFAMASAALAVVLAAGAAHAQPVTWMQMTPTAFGGTPPSGSTYSLPGVGPVTMTYTADPNLTTTRGDQTATFGGGTAGTYSWGAVEQFGRTHVNPTPLTVAWSVTYTFSGTIPAQSLVLGVAGLGRRDAVPGGTPGAVSDVTVNQNGTYAGEFFGTGGPFGANLYTGSLGQFKLENSVTGIGGANPHWNTAWGVVRIDDAISSLTVHVVQTAGDGLGMNIGVIVPAPGAATAMLGMSGLAALRRRRTSVG